MAGRKPAPTLKTVWGLAKSPELQLTSEELHLLVAGYIGKDLSLIHISSVMNFGVPDTYLV